MMSDSMLFPPIVTHSVLAHFHHLSHSLPFLDLYSSTYCLPCTALWSVNTCIFNSILIRRLFLICSRVSMLFRNPSLRQRCLKPRTSESKSNVQQEPVTIAYAAILHTPPIFSTARSIHPKNHILHDDITRIMTCSYAHL